MTGYAHLTREWERGALSVEIKSVNHRYLEVQFRLNETLRLLEPVLREKIQARLRRGKLEVRMDWKPAKSGNHPETANTGTLEWLKGQAGVVQEIFPDATALSVGEVLRWPGVLEENSSGSLPPQEFCLELAEEALQNFFATRGREGEQLKALLLEKAAAVESATHELQQHLPELNAAYQARLKTRLEEVLAQGVEERLHQEMVLYCARTDVEEELARIRVHVGEIRHSLSQGGSVGKRIDFLLQELNREANTLGSKSGNLDTTRVMIDLKVLIEQMREQVQNLE
jgi:uncharacterized protein (TIGR00255 family)